MYASQAVSKKSLGLTLALLLGWAATGPSAQAASFSLAPGSLEANLNNDSIYFEYDRPLSQANNLHLHLGLLYTEQHAQDSATVGVLGLHGVETDNRSYRAAVGLRLYGYSAPHSTSGTALSLGGLFYHTLPKISHVSFGGYAYVAPKVASFGDTEYLYEAGARIAYRVIQNTDIFLGYRYLYLKTLVRGFDETLEEGPNLGFRINF